MRPTIASGDTNISVRKRRRKKKQKVRNEAMFIRARALSYSCCTDQSRVDLGAGEAVRVVGAACFAFLFRKL